MAIVDQVVGKRVYFDTNIFIYIFEGSPEYQDIVMPLIALAESDDIAIFTNEITLGELLVSPFKNQQKEIGLLCRTPPKIPVAVIINNTRY